MMSTIISHPAYSFWQRTCGDYYLSGTIPLPWLVLAHEGGGSALVVGLLLWHLKGIKKTAENLTVTRKVAWERMRINRCALARGLERLENANLITTRRGRGKAIRVTILLPVPRQMHRSDKDEK
jgi:hypothetical protein